MTTSSRQLSAVSGIQPDVSAPAMACPACSFTDFTTLDTVLAAEQHAIYASGDASVVQQLNHTLAASPSFEMRCCKGCCLQFAQPSQAPPAAWYAVLYSAMNLYPEDRWEYSWVRAALGQGQGQSLLDYGCGSGHFLSTVHPLLSKAVGVDFSPNGTAEAARSGLDVRLLRPGEDPAAGLPQVDHVTAFHVLEHLANPDELFDLARRIGRTNTRLWVAVPSDQRASRRYGEADALDSPPHHLSRWTPAALTQLGRRKGWRLQQLTYQPLPLGMRVWEATRRAAAYARLEAVPAGPRRLLRRLLALAVWLRGCDAMRRATGFSMLACYSMETNDR